eukprot:TRINITY_DN11333_c0_g1_i1.p1 TRINITY_DN11333_c0_g1~~TRINITY_DN11333_c0_g1_i1.p1  ORF type:complete len:259 (+),score=55.58 TRINITY_DN11333_c0_g1_i1:71-847(+)
MRLWAPLLATAAMLVNASDGGSEAKNAEVFEAEDTAAIGEEIALGGVVGRRLHRGGGGWGNRGYRYRRGYGPWWSRCFVGDATMGTPSGKVMLKDLRIGTQVFTGASFEEVLGFLHSASNLESSFLTIQHSTGELRVSPKHVLMTKDGEKMASDVVVGEQLMTTTGSSSALSAQLDVSDQGIFAPLTRSGLVVVDDVEASNYASVSSLRLPHSAMHSVFFIARLLGPNGAVAQRNEYIHPIAALLTDVIKVDKLLEFF